MKNKGIFDKGPKGIIGLMGKAGAGKDTAADILMRHVENSYKYSFADPLKEMCAFVFDIPKVWMYDQDLKKREVNVNLNNVGVRRRMEEWVYQNIHQSQKWNWHLARPELSGMSYCKEERYQEFANKIIIGITDVLRNLDADGKAKMHTHGYSEGTYFTVTIRTILQYIGTEVIRTIIDKRFWAEIKAPQDDVCRKIVFTPDCRFETEVDFILSSGNGKIIVVQNDDLEESSFGGHSSEELVDRVGDYVSEKYPEESVIYLQNSFGDGSLQKLEEQIVNLINEKGTLPL